MEGYQAHPTCNPMIVQFSDKDDLLVKSNNTRNKDYTQETDPPLYEAKPKPVSVMQYPPKPEVPMFGPMYQPPR